MIPEMSSQSGVSFLFSLPRSSFARTSTLPVRTQVNRSNKCAILATAPVNRSRREENVEGLLYVDSSCIDCDTCRFKEN